MLRRQLAVFSTLLLLFVLLLGHTHAWEDIAQKVQAVDESSNRDATTEANTNVLSVKLPGTTDIPSEDADKQQSKRHICLTGTCVLAPFLLTSGSVNISAPSHQSWLAPTLAGVTDGVEPGHDPPVPRSRA